MRGHLGGFHWFLLLHSIAINVFCVSLYTTPCHMEAELPRSSTLLAGMLAVDGATGEKQSVPEARGAPSCDRREFIRPGPSQQVQGPSVMPTGDNPSASLQDQ